ncbi:MAG: hypothetical protein ABII90_15215, partial [Bacteroidota bacterium]
MKKLLQITAIFAMFAISSPAQVQEEWVSTFNGPDSLDDGGFAMDVSGNIYVTGASEISPGIYKITTLKYTPAGTLKWAVQHITPGAFPEMDFANDIKVDSAGNAYIAGSVAIGPFGSDKEFTTLKYDSSGVLQWAAIHADTGEAYSLVIGQSGIYVTGWTKAGNTDKHDYTTVKYDPNGTQLWSVKYNGGDDDVAKEIVCDNADNTYVTGISISPGTNQANHHTVKYNSSGVEQWVAQYNYGPIPQTSTDRQNSLDACNIALDAGNNIYVSGVKDNGSLDYAVIKYDNSGTELWTVNYNGPDQLRDLVTDIAVNPAGEVYLTGESKSLSSLNDYVTVKFSTSGTLDWVQRYNGSANSDDKANAVVLDINGSVYVTGGSLETGTVRDFTTIKYTSDGIIEWVMNYDGIGSNIDVAYDVHVDNDLNVYVAGLSFNGTDFDFATIKYSQQMLTVNDITLGTVSSFALLAGGSIIANDSISAIGNAGAIGSVSNYVFATDTLFPSNDPKVQQAIADLNIAIAIIENIPLDTAISGNLEGQIL